MRGVAGLRCWRRIWPLRCWGAGRRSRRLVWRLGCWRCSRSRCRIGAIGIGVLVLYRDRPGCVERGSACLRAGAGRRRRPGDPRPAGRRCGGHVARAAGGRAAALGGSASGDGVIAVQLGVSLDEAFVRLRAHAFAHGRPLPLLARELVAGGRHHPQRAVPVPERGGALPLNATAIAGRRSAKIWRRTPVAGRRPRRRLCRSGFAPVQAGPMRVRRASAKHGLTGRNWVTRFNHEWCTRIGVYRLMENPSRKIYRIPMDTSDSPIRVRPQAPTTNRNGQTHDKFRVGWQRVSLRTTGSARSSRSEKLTERQRRLLAAQLK